MAGPTAAAPRAIGGGAAPKRVVEWYDTELENAYWRETYESRPYFDPNTSYDEIQPAYRYGWESRMRFVEKSFEQAEPELVTGWELGRAHSQLSWARARIACWEAWSRVDDAMKRQNGQPPNNGSA